MLPFISIEIPYGELKEIKLIKHFWKKFYKCINNGFRIAITWKNNPYFL